MIRATGFEGSYVIVDDAWETAEWTVRHRGTGSRHPFLNTGKYWKFLNTGKYWKTSPAQ